MKWFQLTIEGSQPPTRVSHSCTILSSKQDNTNTNTNGGTCSNYSVNDFGTIVFYGGGSPTSSNNYTDLAFMSVGIGAIDEIAKPQNTQSMGKLNKLLGSNVNNGSGSSGNNATINNNGNSAANQKQTTITGFNNNNKTTSTTANQLINNNSNAAQRKTYSKLPLYTGSTIFHWENSTADGENPSNRINHSLTALNTGSYKGKILLIGGIIVGNESTSPNSSGKNIPTTNNTTTNTVGSSINNNINLSNDIYLLDSESLFWVKCQAVGNAPEARHSHFVHQISNDTLLLFGGIGENGKIFSDIHLLNLSNQNQLKWIQPNVFGTVLNLKDKDYKVCFSSGYLWVMISESKEMYRMDINTFRWSVVIYNGNFPRGGFQSEYTLVPVGCGINNGLGNIILLLVENEIFYFDTTSLEWGELDVDNCERPMKRKYHTVSLIDSMLIVVGGQSELPLSTISTRDIEMIDLKNLFIKKKISTK